MEHGNNSRDDARKVGSALRRRYKNLADRILSNTGQVGDCYCWLLACSEKGYGRITMRVAGRPRGMWVHRVAWTVFKGPIPPGMTLDHIHDVCKYKNCWRLDHLEMVPVEENTRRAWSSGRYSKA